MQARGEWISFKDLADLLKQPESRTVLSSEFILNQLHALIRAPFEIVTDYCEDFEAHHPERGLLTQLKESPWYDVARFIRHAISHNFRFEFTKGDLKRLPATCNGIAITEELQGQPISYRQFWHKPGYELFLEMRDFAKRLPDTLPR